MTLSIWFWILMLVWVLFSGWSQYVPGQPYTYRNWGGSLLLFLLFLLLGWKVFGSPVSG